MNKYRTHNCNDLRKDKVGDKVRLSGWINKKRDHGNLLFLDLRDNYGITQCIIDKENSNFDKLEKIQLETVISIDGYAEGKEEVERERMNDREQERERERETDRKREREREK